MDTLYILTSGSTAYMSRNTSQMVCVNIFLLLYNSRYYYSVEHKLKRNSELASSDTNSFNYASRCIHFIQCGYG